MNEQINQYPVVYYPQTVVYQPQSFLTIALGIFIIFILFAEVFRSIKSALF